MKRRNFITAILAVVGAGATAGHDEPGANGLEATPVPAPSVTSGYLNADSDDKSTVTFAMTSTSTSANVTWIELP